MNSTQQRRVTSDERPRARGDSEGSDVTGDALGARRSSLVARAALGLLVLAACSRGAAEEAPADGPVAQTVGAENVTVAQEERIQTGPPISGSLSPEREAQLRAEVGGSVLQIAAEQGQAVRAGALLARIDDVTTRDQVISARSNVRSAEASAEVAARELQRSERLVAAGAIAERDVESARRVNVAAQAALADARARLATAAQQQANTRVVAPFAGVVSQRAVNAGDVVAPGALLYTVVAPGSMRLEASVPAEQLAQVRVGMPVQFRVNGYGDREFEGRITRVNPVADPTTRQVRIVASIPNAGSALVGGLFAEGRVASETRDGIVLPQNAVNEAGLAPTVVRVKGGRAERVSVELGIRDAAAETVEVRTGLAAGDTVLVGAAAGITAGTPVRVGAVGDQAAASSAGTATGAPESAPAPPAAKR
jgi:RND family efflux transporter MFP subunit